MILKNPRFEISAASPKQFLTGGKPEIAFVGRSNVGKSSMINSLLNRKAIAKVGATPGKTRMVNYFNLDDKFYFVDLPGYGYANVSKEQKSEWSKLIEAYFQRRKDTGVFLILLLDIRHEPSEDDKMMYDWMISYDLPFCVVATKADKISRQHHKKHIEMICKSLQIDDIKRVIPFSAEKRLGVEEVWTEIEKYLE